MSDKASQNTPVTAEILHQFQPKSDENEMCVCGHNIRSGVHVRPRLYTEEEVAERERLARLDEAKEWLHKAKLLQMSEVELSYAEDLDKGLTVEEQQALYTMCELIFRRAMKQIGQMLDVRIAQLESAGTERSEKS